MCVFMYVCMHAYMCKLELFQFEQPHIFHEMDKRNKTEVDEEINNKNNNDDSFAAHRTNLQLLDPACD